MKPIALISFLVNSLNIRSLSSYLKENQFEPLCVFCEKPFSKKALDSTIQLLKEKEVRLVGISLVTDDYADAIALTEAIKKELKILVVWGGAHVNVRPEECLKHADIICRGEGEEALLDLVKSVDETGIVNTHINNLWIKTANGIIKNELRNLEEDLDKYPFPDFDLSTQFVIGEKGSEQLAAKHLQSEYSIMTSRGCPYRCTYCYNNYRWDHYKGKGKYLRFRSIKNIIEELKAAKTIFPGLQKVNFWDDSFVSRPIDDFLNFKESYPKEVALPLFCLVEPMAFSYEKTKILAECGLVGLQVGIQSGSERVNKEVYQRNVENTEILKMAAYIKSLNIQVVYDLIFNNPYETIEDIKKTIQLFLEIPRPFALQGYNLVFYPETKLAQKALVDGYIKVKEEQEDFSTIESAEDSPIAKKGKSKVSGRFFSIHYDYSDKVYYNTLFSLIPFPRMPRRIIAYFAATTNPLKKPLLTLFLKSYFLLSRIDNLVKQKPS